MAELPPKPVVFLPPDQFAIERVFPIKNLVGGDEPDILTSPLTRYGGNALSDTSTPPSYSSEVLEREREEQGGIGGSASSSVYEPPPYPRIPSDDTIRPLELRFKDGDTRSKQASVSDEESVRPITERAQMVPSVKGPGEVAPAMTYGQSFYRCEDEPIHTPGAIQQYGALVALRYDHWGNLQVRIASENTATLLKRTPEQLFMLPSYLDILLPDVREDVVARMANALGSANGEISDTHLDVFQTSIVAPDGEEITLWCAIHIAQGTKDLIVCEYEEVPHVFFMDGINEERLLPKTPLHNYVDHVVTEEERLLSTTSGSNPLRVLQIARRKRKTQQVSSMDIFNAMTQAQQQLINAKSVQSVLDVTVGLISELTGFHRVMLYRFDAKKNGCVQAELVDPLASSDFFRGTREDTPREICR